MKKIKGNLHWSHNAGTAFLAVWFWTANCTAGFDARAKLLQFRYKLNIVDWFMETETLIEQIQKKNQILKKINEKKNIEVLLSSFLAMCRPGQTSATKKNNTT